MTDTSEAGERDTSPVPPTKIRAVRVPDLDWENAQDQAHLERTTVSTVIRFALTAYAKDPETFWNAIVGITHGELLAAEREDSKGPA